MNEFLRLDTVMQLEEDNQSLAEKNQALREQASHYRAQTNDYRKTVHYGLMMVAYYGGSVLIDDFPEFLKLGESIDDIADIAALPLAMAGVVYAVRFIKRATST